MQIIYRFATTEESDPQGCDRCTAEVPVAIFTGTHVEGHAWIDELLCEICANSPMSAYPNQRERSEIVAVNAANQVLLALKAAGLPLFPAPEGAERPFVVRCDDEREKWVEVTE